jgi:autotransporter-associated beta strand protein
VNQNGGNVTVGQQMRIGHWPTNTSTYTMNSGSLTIANANSVTSPSGATEQNGGLYLGIDGTGILNHVDGVITTDWVVLDNRADTGGTDTYNLSGGTLAVRMNHGIIRRNGSAQFNFSGGIIKNVGTGVSANIDTPLTITGTEATIDTNGATNSFNALQAISGTGDLTKAGAGTLNLNAASPAWTGSTTVDAGVLMVNGSISGSTVTIVNGTLSGTGSTGPVLLTGGFLAPGNTTGTLNTTGLAFDGGT